MEDCYFHRMQATKYKNAKVNWIGLGNIEKFKHPVTQFNYNKEEQNESSRVL